MRILFGLFLSACAGIHAQDAGLIAPSRIESLAEDLAGTEASESTLERRRLLKRVIRRGESLVTANPEAANRFAVLAVMFQGRQKLYAVDDSTRNWNELLATCDALAEAPDDQAVLRLPADVMLAQISLAKCGESPEETQTVITDLVASYRGTGAEADSLMIAAMLAMGTGNAELLMEFRARLSELFGAEPKVKAFLRERFRESPPDFMFSGIFKRADGAALHFPVDRLGHVYLVCFWSQESDYLMDRLREVKELQASYPGLSEVYSFNLDELPDHGAGILKRHGLDWVPMQLSGGRESDCYLAYGHAPGASFSCIAVNECGYSRGLGVRWEGKMPSFEHQLKDALSSRQIAVRDPSYFRLMQSLVVGDWLVSDQAAAPTKRAEGDVSEDVLRAVQACFPPAEKRCRLTKAEALANYRQAEALCTDVINSHAEAQDLYRVRNRRIIALMGMWHVAGEPEFLERARVAAANAAAAPVPRDALVVPQFCIARHAIRETPGNAAEIIAAFIAACGGEKAGAAAHAAAVLLALDAGARELYLQQREIIMARFDDDPRAQPVASFFLGRASALSLFRGSGLHGYQYRFENTGLDEILPRVFRGNFATIDGQQIVLPDDADGRHTVVVFIDPTVAEDGKTEAPQGEFIMKGKERFYITGVGAEVQRQYVSGLNHAVKDHRSKEMRLLLAFLTDDQSLVRSMMSRNGWECDAVCIAGGVNSATAVRYGAFASDRLPKTYVVAPNGRISATYNGLYVVRDYGGGLRMTGNRSHMLQAVISVKSIIRNYDAQLGKEAMAAKNYSEAAKRLAVSFPGKPVGPNRYVRECVQANMAVENWDVALESSNAACGEGKMGRPYFLTAFASDLNIRANILEKLGRRAEAERDRKKARELYEKAADVWEARAADMEKKGQEDKAQRWWSEAKRARQRQQQ